MSCSVLPTVSVIVPCYNYGHFLPGCIASILSQEGVNVDVLIIDDASPDGSGEVASALAEQDSRITVIRHDVNQGHISTFNEGLSHIQGDYAVLISADDLLTQGALARATTLMEAHPSVGLVYGHPVNFIEPNIPIQNLRLRSWSVWSGHKWIAAQCRRGLNCIYSPEVVVRSSVQVKVGEYNPDLPHTADLEMWLRFAVISDIGHVNGPDQALRRVHNESMMQSNYSDQNEDLIQRHKAFEHFFSNSGKNLPNAEHCLRAVRMRLAEDAIGTACDILLAEGDGTDIYILVKLAERILGSVECVRAWHELSLLRLNHLSMWDRLKLYAYSLRRDLDGRIRWRRWRWKGI